MIFAPRLRQATMRTIAALAVGMPRRFGSIPTITAYSLLMRQNGPALFTRVPASTRLMTSSSSSFAAPTPPESKGINIFQDIDVSNVQSQPSAQLRNSDPDAVFVVTGASRGIGLQFIKTLLQHTQGTIVACCRSPDDATHDLNEFLSTLDETQRERIELVQLNVEQQDSIDQAAETIKQKHERVDLLLNVAGILGDGKSVPGPERSVSKIERDWMEKTFQVNVIGPVMLSQALAPLMAQKRRRAKGDDDTPSRPNAVIANLSARVGSISDNGLGGWYSYRMSKAALNQATRTLANELKRQSVWCIALHPGTTDTDLSKPFQKNVQEGRLFPVDFTVESLLKVIDSMEAENSGGLYDWAGKAIPF